METKEFANQTLDPIPDNCVADLSRDRHAQAQPLIFSKYVDIKMRGSQATAINAQSIKV